jgi:predicted dehydrogenase
VAVVGTGSAGLRHIANLARLGVGEIVAVSEHHRRPAVVVEGRKVCVTHDYDATLDIVDAVVIANPTSLHHDYLARAISAGRHVLCEKPVSTAATGLDALADEADRMAVTVAVGCQFRFNRMLGRFRDRVHAGGLGTIVDVDAQLGEHLADYHPDEDYRESYAARRSLGGGVLLTQVHQIDYLHWIFGPFDTVFAAGGHVTDLEIDVEDSASYLLRSVSGVPVRAHLDYIQRPKRQAVTVTGTAGRLTWDYHRNEVCFVPPLLDAAPEVARETFDRNEMFVDLMDDFLMAVERGEPPRTTLRDAAAVLEIVDGIKSSIQDGRAVPLSGGNGRE